MLGRLGILSEWVREIVSGGVGRRWLAGLQQQPLFDFHMCVVEWTSDLWLHLRVL